MKDKEIKPYDFKRTLQKVFWAIGDLALVGLAVYYTKEVKYLAMIPFIVGMRDYLRHSKRKN